MSPSINARRSEAESSLDFVAFRAVPTTLYPRARNARTIPAPMPCDAPVTITVLGGLFIVTLPRRNSAVHRGFPRDVLPVGNGHNRDCAQEPLRWRLPARSHGCPIPAL